MLLYVTTGEPQDREARPLHTIPKTVCGLYDMGMREHSRKALLLHREGDSWVETPDWRFDRLVIRIAVYARERLEVKAGERLAIMGSLSPLWLAGEFAILGLAGAAVALSPALSDEEIVRALWTTKARLALATDVECAARLLRLRARAEALETVIGPDGAGNGDGAFLGLGPFFELADTLDTAERAQGFRATARAVAPEAVALWHFAPGVPAMTQGLTHAQAMSAVREHLLALPAHAGDLAYVQGGEVLLSSRLACHAFVGDGYTTLALGEKGRASEEIPTLRPSKILASPDWVEGMWSQVQATADGWLVGLSRRLPDVAGLRSWVQRSPSVKRALAARLGDRVRWVESLQAISTDVSRSFSRSGVRLVANAASVAGGRAEAHGLGLPGTASGNGSGKVSAAGA